MTRAIERRRKVVQVTLSDDERAALRRLTAMHPEGTQSAVVGDLVMAEDAKRPPNDRAE